MIDIPSVIHKDKNGNERAVSLATRLLTDRIVMVTGQVTDELAESVVQQLLYLESENPDAPITLYCSGPGGSVTAGCSILDTMEMVSCPIKTLVSGQVASMSAVIALSGDKGHRKIMPKARFMLHGISSGAQGTLKDMRISLEEARRLEEMLFEHMSKCTGKKVTVLQKDCDRDFWMTAEEAVKYGCCDAITEKH